ncbi:hypothetical protein SNE40_015760 [Patella caerulea]|uniref:Uncharacterized protein n=1 Tax=Patella caerulea TaxID=87958 RepID=A0AAN8JPT6_PATCE
MASELNLMFYLLCLMSFIQVITAEYCTYYYEAFYNTDSKTRYCSYGCCTTGTDATFINVCCNRKGVYTYKPHSIIIGIIVGVVALIITIIVVIVIIVCCCCKRQPATQGHVITAPNTTVVYSNTTQTSSMPPGVGYPPPHGTNNLPSPPTGYSSPPPPYDTVTSPGQDNKGFDTNVNMN